jgi:hypothetical protein
MDARKKSGKNATLTVLRAVTKLVASLSDDELSALSSGDASLTLSLTGLDARRREKKSTDREMDEPDYSFLKKGLEEAKSTEAGLAILNSAALTRAELELMARLLELPISKHDNVSRLEEKIVAASVGTRLNSLAVRGR